MGYSVVVLRMKIGFPLPLLFLLLSFRMDHAMKTNDYIGSQCLTTPSDTDESVFDMNMESVFQNLLTAPTGFSNTTVGEGSDKVYGLAQCRGDLGQDACEDCISNSTQQIVETYCPNATDAIIWYENCQLRYSATNFFGSLDVDHYSSWHYVYDSVEEPDAFKEKLGSLLINLTSQATREPSTVMFATGYTQHTTLVSIYGLVQCTGDTSLADCKQCLDTTRSQIPTTCDAAHGCEIATGSCRLRYDTQLFYGTQTTPASSPPAPPSNSSRSPSPSPSPSLSPSHPRISAPPDSRSSVLTPPPNSSPVSNATSNTTTPG
ncbi:hypothetical protein EJ110_NYTH43834 [Nymphaea thermarum]|nr:hypothetical protein EJ110_NYTH43834 [Nymphaea thermarum]